MLLVQGHPPPQLSDLPYNRRAAFRVTSLTAASKTLGLSSCSTPKAAQISDMLLVKNLQKVCLSWYLVSKPYLLTFTSSLGAISNFAQSLLVGLVLPREHSQAPPLTADSHPLAISTFRLQLGQVPEGVSGRTGVIPGDGVDDKFTSQPGSQILFKLLA